jgi:hypothetical protein
VQGKMPRDRNLGDAVERDNGESDQEVIDAHCKDNLENVCPDYRVPRKKTGVG